jgi:2-polyprenyl-3-methyl-5-hydroxy-6-metoxy-1,4-benzoquinol methylase
VIASLAKKMEKLYKNKKELIEDVVSANDIVLDVGFWGQGVRIDDKNWVHAILKNRVKKVYGLDVDFDETKFSAEHYKKCSAEKFFFDIKFDIIAAFDLIEHLSNPGLFLDAAADNLKDNGVLVITTPNCFNLFNLSEKITKNEPTVNRDHTCYFNKKTIKRLLEKNGWELKRLSYLYTQNVNFKQSYKKIFLNGIYWLLSKITNKFIETIVIEAIKVN